MQERFARVTFKSLTVAALLLSVGALPVAGQAPTCRDLELKFKTNAPEAVSAQLNVALFRAADAGCVDLARRLLTAGASLESRDGLGNAALARAARAGHLALIQLFLAEGAAIDARNLEGSTALFLAAENERQATVADLLAKGANPNLPGRSGVTALAAAAFKGNGRIVERLIARGADPDVVDATGKAAITYAAGAVLCRDCAAATRQGCGSEASLRQRPDRTDVGRGPRGRSQCARCH